MNKSILFLFAYFLISCAGSSKKVDKVALSEPYMISFDLEKLSDKDAPMMSDVIDSLEYIKLEYSNEFPIGIILDEKRPYITDDYIFIYCSHGAGLLQYRRSGEFVRKIGSYGRGPGEYLQLRGFVIDEKMGIVYTILNWRAVIAKYDYLSGKYLEELQIIDLNGKLMTMYNNNVASIYSLSDSEVFVNPSGTKRAQESKYDAFYTLDLSSGHIAKHKESRIYGLDNLGVNIQESAVLASITNIVWYDSNNRLNFWESLNDTVFVVNSDFTTTPRIIVDFGNYKLDVQTTLSVFDSAVYSSKLRILDRLCESSRYIFFLFAFQNRYISTVYDKSTGNQNILGSMSSDQFKINNLFMGLYNDIDGGFSNMMQYDKDMWFRSYSATKMIDILTPEHFGDVKSKVKYPERLDKLKKFVLGLDENDNPVFVIAHLKKNKL